MSNEVKESEYTVEDIKQAAKEGNASAQYLLSRTYLEEGEVEKSMENLSLAVKLGYPAALATSGIFLLTNQYLPYNPENAMNNLEQAALHRHDEASLIFAHLTHMGLISDPDPEKALRILIDAARRNNPHALCEIAALMQIHDVMSDEGLVMMELAARTGSSLAAYMVASHYKFSADDGSKEALDKRIQFLYMAAKMGNKIAEADFLSHDEKTIDKALENMEPASLTPPQFEWGKIFDDLKAEGKPSALEGEALGKSSLVSLYKFVLTAFELNYLRAAASSMLAFSAEGMTEEEVREKKDDMAEIEKNMPKRGVARFDFLSRDVVVQTIEAKVAAAAKFELSHSENMIVSFERPIGKVDEPSDEVKEMMDSQDKVFDDKCGLRNKKIILSMMDSYEGGEELVSLENIKHNLQAGDMMVVDLSDNLTDTQESSLKKGFKWTATFWVREKPVPPLFTD